jgi:hypothetical protein
MRLSIRFTITAFFVSLIAALSMSNAAAQTAPKSDGIHCESQDGYNPYCEQQAGLIVDRHGFRANHSKYCYWAQNYWSPDDGSDQTMVVRTLGHHSRTAYSTTHGLYQKFCGDMPKRGCPKLNFMGKLTDNEGTVTKLNLGTYPTCGARLSVPSPSEPTVKVCAKNTRDVRWPLWLINDDKLVNHQWVGHGKTGCVTKKFSHSGSHPIRVLWKPKTSTVFPRNILLDSHIWLD